MQHVRPLPLLFLILTATVLLPGFPAVAVDDGDDVFSGPQPGERVPALPVRNVFEDPPVDLDPVTSAKDGPLLLIFVHKRERPAFGLTNALLRYALTRRKDGLHSAAVFLTGDLTETANWMRRIRGYFPKGATVAVSPDGIEGPGSFGLNRDVTLTVLIVGNNRVRANFALVQPSMQADGPKIARALVEMLGGPVPDLAEYSGQRMKRMQRRDALDPRLTGLLRQLIQKDATAEQVASAAKELNAHLEKDPAARKRIGEIATRIISAGKLDSYGTPAAQEHLKMWARKFGPKPQSGKSAGQRDSQRNGESASRKRRDSSRQKTGRTTDNAGDSTGRDDRTSSKVPDRNGQEAL